MTAKKDDFWQNKQDWSRRKHLVLEYYLPPLVAKFSAEPFASTTDPNFCHRSRLAACLPAECCMPVQHL
jgi:hypothetical protein